MSPPYGRTSPGLARLTSDLAPNDPAERRLVDVAARHDDAHPAPRQPVPEREQSRETGGPRPLRQVVRGAQQDPERLRDLAVRDRDEVREALEQGAERRLVDAPRGEAVGEGSGRFARDRPARPPRVVS